MAKDRIEPCKFYVHAGCCEKNRDADHFGYCQKCDKYYPRVKKRHLNTKKQKLLKLREKDY